jgi:hypothetical protein
MMGVVPTSTKWLCSRVSSRCCVLGGPWRESPYAPGTGGSASARGLGDRGSSRPGGRAGGAAAERSDGTMQLTAPTKMRCSPERYSRGGGPRLFSVGECMVGGEEKRGKGWRREGYEPQSSKVLYGQSSFQMRNTGAHAADGLRSDVIKRAKLGY